MLPGGMVRDQLRNKPFRRPRRARRRGTEPDAWTNLGPIGPGARWSRGSPPTSRRSRRHATSRGRGSSTQRSRGCSDGRSLGAASASRLPVLPSAQRGVDEPHGPWPGGRSCDEAGCRPISAACRPTPPTPPNIAGKAAPLPEHAGCSWRAPCARRTTLPRLRAAAAMALCTRRALPKTQPCTVWYRLIDDGAVCERCRVSISAQAMRTDDGGARGVQRPGRRARRGWRRPWQRTARAILRATVLRARATSDLAKRRCRVSREAGPPRQDASGDDSGGVPCSAVGAHSPSALSIGAVSWCARAAFEAPGRRGATAKRNRRASGPQGAHGQRLSPSGICAVEAGGCGRTAERRRRPGRPATRRQDAG